MTTSAAAAVGLERDLLGGDPLGRGRVGDAREAFAADFGEELLDERALEVNRIESDLLESFPRLKYVDLEAD